MANSPAARKRRKEARIWVEDDNEPEGGYWYAASIPPKRHGREPGVANNWYCTCPACRKVATKARRSRRKERYADRVWVEKSPEQGYWFAPDAPAHGGRTASNWGCGCPECKQGEKQHKESRDEGN